MAEKIIDVRIERRSHVADGVICLDVVPVDNSQLPKFEAGAHIDVHVSPGLVRQYSLCNPPSESHRYRLGILLDASGRGGSASIHESFIEGRVISIGVPRNLFALAGDAKHFILIAGGIGITPLLAMAYQLNACDGSFELHYLCRSRSRAAFIEELTASEFSDRIHIYFDDDFASGRFDPVLSIPKPNPDTHLYVCGPNGFMTAMTNEATSKGWSARNIHLESFSADANKTGTAFSVEARRSAKTIAVKADETIANALQAAGIDVPLSCESGICGTCLTHVLDGIPDHRDSFMTDAEKAENRQITVCCSRSFSPTLVLDI